MPHARSEPELHSRRVSLYIGASPEAAWKNVVRHWLERIASCTLQDKNPAAVVTASLSQAYFFRSRLLAESKSLLGVKFLSLPQLRELLLRGRNLHVPLREHLRLILGVTAEEFASKSTDDEQCSLQNLLLEMPIVFSASLTSCAPLAGPLMRS